MKKFIIFSLITMFALDTMGQSTLYDDNQYQGVSKVEIGSKGMLIVTAIAIPCENIDKMLLLGGGKSITFKDKDSVNLIVNTLMSQRFLAAHGIELTWTQKV